MTVHIEFGILSNPAEAYFVEMFHYYLLSVLHESGPDGLLIAKQYKSLPIYLIIPRVTLLYWHQTIFFHVSSILIHFLISQNLLNLLNLL